MSQYFESFPEPTQWNGDPESEREWDYEPEPHDVEVERELIRQANERNAWLMRVYRFLEQLRQAVERFKKAGE